MFSDCLKTTLLKNILLERVAAGHVEIGKPFVFGVRTIEGWKNHQSNDLNQIQNLVQVFTTHIFHTKSRAQFEFHCSYTWRF